MIRTNRWFRCVGSVHFDVSLGQIVDLVYPVDLTEDESFEIAFASIPDVGTHDEAVVHHFILNVGGDRVFGTAKFMQKWDESVDRGAVQRAIFLLSPLPFPKLAEQVISVLNIDSTKDDLVQLWNTICSWNEPICCSVLKSSVPVEINYELPCFRRRGYDGQSLPYNLCRLALPSINSPRMSGMWEATSPVRYQHSTITDVSFLMEKFAAPLSTKTSKILGGAAHEVGHLALNLARAAAETMPEDSPKSESELREPSGQSSASSFVHPGCSTIKHLYSDLPLLTEILPMHVGRIFKLWELIISGHTVQVISESARDVSMAALLLTTVIEPLIYCGDVLPYITMQSNRNIHPQSLVGGAIVGCTNPVLLCSQADAIDTKCAVLTIGEESKIDVLSKHKKLTEKSSRKSSGCVKSELLCNGLFRVSTPVLKPVVSGKDIKNELSLLTQRFIEPIHNYLQDVLQQSAPGIFVGTAWGFFYTNKNLASNCSFANAWEQTSSTDKQLIERLPPPFSMADLLDFVENDFLTNGHVAVELHENTPSVPSVGWKRGRDVLDLYRSFLTTATALNFIVDVYKRAFRDFICSADLPSLLLHFSKSETKLQFLSQIESVFNIENGAPIADRSLLNVLRTLMGPLPVFRDGLMKQLR